nr:hypothetical protein [Bacillus cereus]
MKFSRVSQVSELTGLNPGRTRYYSEEQIFHYLKGECPNNRTVKE